MIRVAVSAKRTVLGRFVGSPFVDFRVSGFNKGAGCSILRNDTADLIAVCLESALRFTGKTLLGMFSRNMVMVLVDTID